MFNLFKKKTEKIPLQLISVKGNKENLSYPADHLYS